MQNFGKGGRARERSWTTPVFKRRPEGKKFCENGEVSTEGGTDARGNIKMIDSAKVVTECKTVPESHPLDLVSLIIKDFSDFRTD